MIDQEDRPSEPPRDPDAVGVRPMSAWAALSWAAGSTFAFVWCVSLVFSLREGDSFDLVSGFACQAIAYLLTLYAIVRVYAPNVGIRDFVGIRASDPSFYWMSILLGVTTSISVSALYGQVLEWFPNDSADHLFEMFKDAPQYKRIVMGAIVAGFGPVVEEMLFRGALFRPLRKRYTPGFVVLVTAALFGLVHIEWQSMLPLAIAGAAVGLLRWQSGSLLPSMLFHMAFNAVPLTQVLMGADGAATDAEDFPLEVVAVAVASALLLGRVTMYFGNRPAAVAARDKDLP